jgi:hypothetical protein
MRCTCGSTNSDVIRTEHDEDNLTLRMRKCRNCEERYATEERLIPTAAFFTRAHSLAVRNRTAYRTMHRDCYYCGNAYRGGTYRQHCRTTAHENSLRGRHTAASREANRIRVRRNYWRDRGFEVPLNQLRRTA